ncbi:MAG: hypothetical protein QOF69_2595, partial [Solirubrobacteraceae bacterium]|nr:hypothetical protein [Solirubrobacteraceae bacterium]
GHDALAAVAVGRLDDEPAQLRHRRGASRFRHRPWTRDRPHASKALRRVRGLSAPATDGATGRSARLVGVIGHEPRACDDGARQRPERIGDTEVSYRDAASILTRATGFMSDYDFTLNPYSGCGFGCSYCYAAFFSRDPQRSDSWGRWVEVKQNALERLDRRRTSLTGKAIYMSSVTDPYQPIERRLLLVRGLLEALAEQQPRLVVQTRSPLVTRDIDVLRRFEHVRVNMTVTTDSDAVRKGFEPMCPGNRARLAAIATVAASGIETCVTMTPLLPVERPEQFARDLLDTGVRRFVVQPFHLDRGRFVAGTREAALTLIRELSWTPERYRATVDILRQHLPVLIEGREGFAP